MKRALILVLALAACSNGAPDAKDRASSAFVPPVTAKPEPVEGQRNVTPLTAYVGRSPRDAVDGVSFFDRTDVAGALIETAPEPQLRDLIVGREAVQVPIFRRGSLVAAHGCEPHDCSGHNWTMLVAISGDVDAAALCHHDAETMGDFSHWTTRRGGERRPGDCPQA